MVGLAVGGEDADDLNSAELYDPVTGIWSPTGSLHTPREYHQANLLPNGQVVVTGGIIDYDHDVRDGELYNPVTGAWSKGGALLIRRRLNTATLLQDGTVLVSGGYHFNLLSAAEIGAPR